MVLLVCFWYSFLVYVIFSYSSYSTIAILATNLYCDFLIFYISGYPYQIVYDTYTRIHAIKDVNDNLGFLCQQRQTPYLWSKIFWAFVPILLSSILVSYQLPCLLCIRSIESRCSVADIILDESESSIESSSCQIDSGHRKGTHPVWSF